MNLPFKTLPDLLRHFDSEEKCRDLLEKMRNRRKKGDKPLKFDMPFEEALKKALNTPLPKKKRKRNPE